MSGFEEQSNGKIAKEEELFLESKDNESYLERLVNKGYPKNTVVEFLSDLDSKILQKYHQEIQQTSRYKKLINATEWKLAKIYAEKFWPLNNRASVDDKNILIEYFEKCILKKHLQKYKIDETFRFSRGPARNLRVNEHDIDALFVYNYLKIPEAERNKLLENFPEKHLIRLARFNKLKYIDTYHKTTKELDKYKILSEIRETTERKILTIEQLLKENHLPTEYISESLKKINEVESDERIQMKNITSETTLSEYAFGLKTRNNYTQTLKELPKISIYRHIGRVLKQLGEHLICDQKPEAENDNVILAQLHNLEKKFDEKSQKKFLSIDVKWKEEQLQKIYSDDDIPRLDKFYSKNNERFKWIKIYHRHIKETIHRELLKFFDKNEIESLASIKENPAFMSNIEKILTNQSIYENSVNREFKKFKDAWDNYGNTKRPTLDYIILSAVKGIIYLKMYKKRGSKYMKSKTYQNEIFLRDHAEKLSREELLERGPSNEICRKIYHDITNIVTEYESEITGSIKEIDFLKLLFLLEKNWYELYTDAKAQVNSIAVTNTKILSEIKNTISNKKENKELVYKIQQLEKNIVNKINQDRNKKDTSYKKDLRFRTPPELNKYKIISDSKMDCLDTSGKYALQGWTIIQNKHSTTLNIIYGYNSVIGRLFLYDAQIEKDKGLFVAGLSGQAELSDIKNWANATIETIISVAKNHNYNKIFFNINPIGDIRNPVTKHSHEFVKYIADTCDIPESNYTYQKLGSGRKPRFFQLNTKAKEKYTKHIQVSRDEDLVGTFFVEGMFGTREEAINSQISLNPEKEKFVPYFFEKEGYAPIITYKL